jgi:hypothetical protein
MNSILKDTEKVKEKRNKLKEKQEFAEEKQKRLERLKERVEVERDPTRLYKMTSTWKNRVTTPRSESCGAIVGITNNIPHLAVPSWRQGV